MHTGEPQRKSSFSMIQFDSVHLTFLDEHINFFLKHGPVQKIKSCNLILTSLVRFTHHVILDFRSRDQRYDVKYRVGGPRGLSGRVLLVGNIGPRIFGG